MIEQETASIIKYVLDSAGNPSPYYYSIPQDFVVPAAYFPVPTIGTRGETLRTFACEFEWYIKFFHKTTHEAYALAYAALMAIRTARNLIPLITQEGVYEGSGLRIDDLTVSAIDDGAVQLKVSWDSRRPYYEPDYLKMVIFHINNDWLKQPLYQEPQLPESIGEIIEQEENS